MEPTGYLHLIRSIDNRYGRVSIGHGSIENAARGYLANLMRVFSMLGIPAAIAAAAQRDQLFADIATFRVAGNLELSRNERDGDFESKLQLELDNVRSQSLELQLSHASESQVVHGAVLIEHYLSSNESAQLDEGIRALLAAALMALFTAAEALINDLWVASLNFGPKAWAAKVLKAHSQGLKPDDPTESRQEKTISLDAIRQQGYDLRQKFGSLLVATKKVDFQSLKNAQRAYSVVFEKPIDDLFADPHHRWLAALESIRNLFAHRAGVIDKKFLSEVSAFPELACLVPGTQLMVDGKMTLAFFNVVEGFGSHLIEFVGTELAKGDPWYPNI